MTAKQLLAGDTNAVVLYDDTNAPVRSPAGVVSDSFHVHWANGNSDTSNGAVVRYNLHLDIIF